MVEKDGVTYKAQREPGREQTEFIRSNNLWFRPIEVRVGPDGALYVVDFCNQAVIHNDTRGPVHGPANAAVRPDRDHYYRPHLEGAAQGGEEAGGGRSWTRRTSRDLAQGDEDQLRMCRKSSRPGDLITETARHQGKGLVGTR